MYQPLADQIRPASLDDVVGQEHILGEGKMLRRIIESGRIPNLIFYGPSGVGKTTVASIIAAQTNRTLYKLNATNASTAEVREILAQPDTLMAPNGVLLYLDEIQYFTKKQQQSLLESIENGKVTLIASTTENPYFYVYNAILSRSTVFEFQAISADAALKAVRRGVRYMEDLEQLTARAEEGALEHIASACGGDIRKAMNAVELLFSAGREKDGILEITRSDAEAVTQKSAQRYDRDGDSHYDILSAFQKSIRNYTKTRKQRCSAIFCIVHDALDSKEVVMRHDRLMLIDIVALRPLSPVLKALLFDYIRRKDPVPFPGDHFSTVSFAPKGNRNAICGPFQISFISSLCEACQHIRDLLRRIPIQIHEKHKFRNLIGLRIFDQLSVLVLPKPKQFRCQRQSVVQPHLQGGNHAPAADSAFLLRNGGRER